MYHIYLKTHAWNDGIHACRFLLYLSIYIYIHIYHTYSGKMKWPLMLTNEEGCWFLPTFWNENARIHLRRMRIWMISCQSVLITFGQEIGYRSKCLPHGRSQKTSQKIPILLQVGMYITQSNNFPGDSSTELPIPINTSGWPQKNLHWSQLTTLAHREPRVETFATEPPSACPVGTRGTRRRPAAIVWPLRVHLFHVCVVRVGRAECSWGGGCGSNANIRWSKVGPQSPSSGTHNSNIFQ